MFLLCFSLAIRILCLATIFAAPPAPRTSRTRSLAGPGPPGGRLGSDRGAYAVYSHWAGTPSAGTPAAADRGGLSSLWGGVPGRAGRRAERVGSGSGLERRRRRRCEGPDGVNSSGGGGGRAPEGEAAAEAVSRLGRKPGAAGGCAAGEPARPPFLPSPQIHY